MRERGEKKKSSPTPNHSFVKGMAATVPTEAAGRFLMFLCRRLLSCLGSLNKADLRGSRESESVLRFFFFFFKQKEGTRQ